MFLWLLPVLTSAQSLSTESSPAVVELPELVQVKGLQFTLGDIARLYGAACALADLELGPSPGVGEVISLDVQMLRQRIVATGWTGFLSFTGARRIQIEAQILIVHPQAIHQQVRAYLLKKWARPGEEIEVQLHSPPLTAISLPTPRKRLRIRPAMQDAESVAHRGRWRVKVEISVDGQVLQQLSLTYLVRRFRTVLITQRALARHAILQAEDVILERRETTALLQRPLTSLEEALGQQAQRAIPVGHILTENEIGQPPLIERGQRITLLVRRPGLEITIEGEALASGYLGKNIRVRNRQTRQILTGRVIEAERVEVFPIRPGGEKAP